MKRLLLTLFMLFSLLPLVQAQSSLHLSKKEFRAQFLDGINAKRTQGCNCGTAFMKPVPALVWNEALAKAADEHARDMYKNHYFNHDSQDGRSLQDRLFKVGYDYKGYQRYAIGENIAFNQQTIEEVLTGWFKSKGHCKNLMNPQFSEIGIAEYQYFWVQDFGGRVSFASR